MLKLLLQIKCLLFLFSYISYRVEHPTELAELQKKEWDPILHWIVNRYPLAFLTKILFVRLNEVISSFILWWQIQCDHWGHHRVWCSSCSRRDQGSIPSASVVLQWLGPCWSVLLVFYVYWMPLLASDCMFTLCDVIIMVSFFVVFFLQVINKQWKLLSLSSLPMLWSTDTYPWKKLWHCPGLSRNFRLESLIVCSFKLLSLIASILFELPGVLLKSVCHFSLSTVL